MTAKKALQVSAPLVEVSVGDRRVRFYRGDILPDGVAKESIEHLESLGYVEKVDGPAESDSK